jgi:hypothetical protein
MDYKVEFLSIDKSTLNKLETDEEMRRRIVQTHVKRLKKALKEGEHFHAPLVVNRNNGTLRLIDGNHRYEAIKEWIEADEKNKTEVLLVIYDGLSEKEEREVFRKWNSGRKQSSDDFVKMHRKEIPILKKMQHDFPVQVKIYPLNENENGLHFSSVMKAYLMAKEDSPNLKTFVGGPQKFVEEVKELDDEDYDKVKNFVSFFTETFGTMRKKNFYQTTSMLNCLMTLYFDNVDEIDEKELSSTFKRKVVDNLDLIDLGRSGGRGATEQLYREMTFTLRGSLKGLKIRRTNNESETQEVSTNSEL